VTSFSANSAPPSASEPAGGATNRCRDARSRRTGAASRFNFRLAGFIFLLLCGTLALSWIVATSLRQLEQLRDDYLAVRGQRYSLGVGFRESIRNLNYGLWQIAVAKDPRVHQEEFLKEADVLRRKIQESRSVPPDPKSLHDARRGAKFAEQLAIIEKAAVAFESYMRDTESVFDPAIRRPYEETVRITRASSMEFVSYCDQLENLQAEGFQQFLAATDQTLKIHQRLLQLSWVLVLVLAAALAVVVYRGLIAPLRARLSQSQNIIERQEKLASLGLLGSGVAHEIRNPLTAIKFRLFVLKKSFPMIAQDEDTILIDSEISRLERIVNDFLRFARPSEPELACVEVGSILEEVEHLFKSSLEQSAIALKVQSEPGVLVRVDRQQILQSLINLVQNAAESIGRGGQIMIGVSRKSLDEPKPGGFFLSANLKVGRVTPCAPGLGKQENGAHGVTRPTDTARPFVALTVADTGKGITPEVEARMFDPFFTTKEGGTGLGLATAARIIEKHGGSLRYTTQVNHGTTFEILLPEAKDHECNDPADRR